MKKALQLSVYLLCLGSTCAFAQGLGNDNVWTINSRFRGPIPYRDITAYMPNGGCDNSTASTNRQQGTIAYNSTMLSLNANNGYTNGCGIFVAGAGPLSTLSTPAQGTAPNPNVIGASGLTTVHYKVAAIDANFGTSAASAAITVTTAPATRTSLNYVAVYWTSVSNAAGYLVYSDASGVYAPLGYSFDCYGFTSGNVCAIIDKGAETNTWTGFNGFWPTTPPPAVTNQALITTIASGGGSTTLYLATPALNTSGVTNAFTLPDNSMFVSQAIAAAATDGSPSNTNKGIVYIPEGLWFMSSIPFPSSGSKGAKIVMAGAIELFGLPIEGPLGSTGSTGNVSISGLGGEYFTDDWGLSCSQITGYLTLGSIFVANGAGTGLDLSHICLNTYQAGIVQGTQGVVTTQDVNFSKISGTGPLLQVDGNVFFSNFTRTNWNDGADNTNSNIPAIWFLGLTNSGHSSVFEFKDNTFISHALRLDGTFASGAGPYYELVFDGTNNIEGNEDPGFIVEVTNNALSDVTIDNLSTADANAVQSIMYSYASTGELAGSNIFLHGSINGFAHLVTALTPAGIPTDCRNWSYDSNNQGGSGVQSIGYWGSLFGTYTGCDLGITQVGYDMQTTEVLTSGGNDPIYGPAGEQMIGHVFRRPRTTLTPSGAGGTLAAGTYYIQVTMLDVAGRESAPSPELSATLSGATSSIAVSSVTGIYFPVSCNIYFGTMGPGTEADYFNSTSVTNGTCTFTLSTTMGELAKAPQQVGNAMRSWLTEENNSNSCLFCGTSNGGTGALGMFLNQTQYNSMVSQGGPGLFIGALLKPTEIQATVSAITYSTTPSINLQLGNVQQFACTTAGASISPTLSNAIAGAELTFIFVQNGTTACTLSFPAAIHGATAVSPTLSSINVWKFIVSNHGSDAYQESATVGMTGGTP